MTLNRRELLAFLPTATLSRYLPSRGELRLAICNEIFRDWSFPETCRGARRNGYTGLEIAPFTLSENPAAISSSRRAELRRVMASEGIDFVGLHWLLSTPKGLHVTTSDARVRKRSWSFLGELIDLCADLGEGGVMVFGSSKQRGTTPGTTVEDAVKRLTEGLAAIAPAAVARGVTILLEPLAPHLCDVVNTIEHAVAIAKEVNSSGIQAMFDVHNTVAERLPHDELVKKYSQHIRHVHLNEMDGKHLGTGSYDFKTLISALDDISYRHWVSLEVFDFSYGAERIARESSQLIRHLENAQRKL